jgi:4-alpha-glucanotransferase
MVGPAGMPTTKPESKLNFSPDHRVAGVLVPVFAVRSADDLGCGDTSSLCDFIDWVAELGFRVVQVLPINETGGDHSPYNAISSMALDVTTIHLQPETPLDLLPAAYEAILKEWDQSRLRGSNVDYAVVKALKWRLLGSAFDEFERRHLGRRTVRGRKFREFTKSQAWLDGYTLFRALMAHNNGVENFDDWPAEQHTVAGARGWMKSLGPEERAVFDRRRSFYAYVQWIAWQQWTIVKSHAESRGVALMGDIPFGISYCSADYYAHPELFESGWCGGAPPETIFKDDIFVQRWGQNWGIPVYDWAAMDRDDFRWWRQRAGGLRDLFHSFRVDHILGFYRLYSFPWRPARNAEFLPLTHEEAAARTGGLLPGFRPRDDSTPENRAANRAQGDHVIGIIQDGALPAVLVAEDLGVVPDYVRPHLASRGIAGFKIPQWEVQPDGRFIPGSEYNRLSVATYATHDHEPLASMYQRWEKYAVAEREGNQEAHLAAEEARREAWKFGEYAGIPTDHRFDGWNDATHEALVQALFASNSWIAVLMVTDLLGTADRFNIPGVANSTNWTRRLDETPEQMRANPAIAAKMARMTAMIAKTGRV